MLVSLAITLIMMGAVVTLFGTISDSVSGSRSIIEISERLRAARNRLQADLQGATATMKPPLRPENDEGYFEIIEGPMQDKSSLAGGVPNATALGDLDDVLMFTVRSRGEPFVGKFDNATTESQVAEVIYFCAPAVNSAGAETDTTLYIDGAAPVRTATLYRRVLLVNPGLAPFAPFDGSDPTVNFYNNYDVSVRLQTRDSGGATLVPNSLGDLTKREFRFAHYGNPNGFPFDVSQIIPAGAPTSNATLSPMKGPANERLGDDVLLTNVLSFDVQVYDPSAPVQATPTAALTPPDPGFTAGTGVLGAYVDLGYTSTLAPPPAFSRNAISGSAMTLTPLTPASLFSYGVTGTSYTYDTWSLHYENNGIDEDGDGKIDEGTNGLDDDTAGPGLGIVDDASEMETQTPFPSQLRGIRVTIRVYEPSSQQVRQVTVVGDFLPD